MVAAVLLLLALAQLGAWVVEVWHKPAEAKTPTRAALEEQDPFGSLARLHPKRVAARMEELKPRRVVVPSLESNLQFGDPRSDVVLTVLSDPACGVCRVQVGDMLARLPGGVKVVTKFWPQSPLRKTPGMLLELARREGVAAAYLKLLQTQKGDLDDAAMLSLLEQAGVPLEKQRAALMDEDHKLGQALQADIAMAEDLQLGPPPVFVLNGYLLDGAALKPERVAEYVERLKAHEALVQGSDYFLMEK